jgi:hypothetical protein
MHKKEKQDIGLQNVIFKKMSKWTSNSWMRSRFEANIQVKNMEKHLKSLSTIEQLELMRKQSQQADLIINELKKTRTNG